MPNVLGKPNLHSGVTLKAVDNLPSPPYLS